MPPPSRDMAQLLHSPVDPFEYLRDYLTRAAMQTIKTSQQAIDNRGEASDSSRLLGLPPGLRNMIYEACLVSPNGIDVAEPSQAREPALLAVCRQIRSEALGIFYSKNVFTSAESWSTSPATIGLTRIGRAKSARVKHLELRSWNLAIEMVCWKCERKANATASFRPWGKRGARAASRRQGRQWARRLARRGLVASSVKVMAVQGTEELARWMRAGEGEGLKQQFEKMRIRKAVAGGDVKPGKGH
ncbi:hypothetical protein LTR53_016293 [Teratosphaeriaceae sp. CCFEE 6253]|nr:hypothetical protein LTR53_016293 [Teratosphaeriaceae sp. CCFEE 6253]